MKITRQFTTEGQNPFATVEWTTRSSRISNPDGSVVFEMKDAEVPVTWSQLATDIMVSKYFRKAGVPQDGGPNGYASDSTSRDPDSTSRDREGVGSDAPAGGPLPDGRGSSEGGSSGAGSGRATTGPECSARQVIHRLAGCWRHWGESHGYFDTAADAQAFYDEIVYMMVHQMCAPNSPQWFNTGLNWAYGISGPAQGHWVVDPKTGEPSLADDAYTHPQPHACFIQSVSDDLVNDGGIMDLWLREARLFKYGSGTGTNFSDLRGENEPLSGGGKSSGLMSFLKIGDRAAGAIKSGGTTRRAAKMVCLDMDHPDIANFINWKVREEIKVAAMVEGMKAIAGEKAGKADPETIGQTAARLGLKLDYDFNGESYQTVSGQNSNNSVRIPDSFFDAVDAGADWSTVFRTTGRTARTFKARDLWDDIAYAAWRCADPGVQYDTTINAWHTCPGAGRINASNPCVTGDTLVATAEGYRRIVDLVGKRVEVINGRGQRVWVDRVFKTGHKPVYELKTRSGYRVTLTADHLVQTANRGDVPAVELTLDDVLILEKPGHGGDFLPLPMAEIIGAAVGDGCISHQPEQDFLSITLGDRERPVAERFRAHLDHCKQWLNQGDGRGLRPTAVIDTKTGVRVGTSVAPILETAARFAVLDAGSENKRFTDEIFTLDRQTQAAVLRGLFTADGTVADYGVKSQFVALDSTSLELLRQTQLLLLGFGIKSKVYENRRALGQEVSLLPDGRGGHALYPVQQMHSLQISRRARVDFENEIGFAPESAKSRRLASLNRRVSTYAEPMTDRVASLTPRGQEDVFDLTEPASEHFVANGIVVHNCSEYMFLDNTACNLASLNVLKFYDPATRELDIERYEHGVDLWTMVLEISVLMAAFPSREIAERSFVYRTLGLGYANLGAVLMQAGIPYDSDAGRAICACLSAVLTGRSYRMSALMAQEHGPFAGFAPERDNMLRVVRNHRRAAHGVARDSGEYEDLRTAPVPIDHDLIRDRKVPLGNAMDLLQHAVKAWDEALALGEKHGYRNAQTTVIAPTGTIGLLMDCDTTGVEPDFALVKFKKLAGGGYFKIANASVKPALVALGYTPDQVADILRSLLGTLDLHVPMPATVPATVGVSLHEWLGDKGLNDDDLNKVTASLPGVFELSFALSPWGLGDEALQRLGIDPAQAKADPSFNALRRLGLSSGQIAELNTLVCGTQTVEGAPHLKDEHLAVFDCASTCGTLGKRFIEVGGHIRMMAAAQPFISGAISKTINLPNEATLDDIKASYRTSWELGLKANALYRDGCKLSQPLNVRSDSDIRDEPGEGDDQAEALAEVECDLDDLAQAAAEGNVRVVVRKEVRIVHRPMRRRLPETRRSITHKFNIAGHEGYLTVGIYEDGAPGELFITMAKEGSTIGGLMDSLGTATSVALQYGVPLDSLVKKFTHQRFEPAGMTTNRDIPFAKSLVDYIFRWLGMEFIPGYREANAPRRPGEDAENATDLLAGERRIAAGNARRIVSESEAEMKPDRRPGLKPDLKAERRGIEIRDRSDDAPVVVQHARLTDQSDPRSGQQSGRPAGQPSTLSMALESAGDAPPCDVCGTITVRSGTCYKCLNCGNSMGCS